jgi:hypothetical protein
VISSKVRVLARWACAIAALAIAVPSNLDRSALSYSVPAVETAVVDAPTTAPTVLIPPAGDHTLQFRHTARAAGRDAILLPRTTGEPSTGPAGAVEVTIPGAARAVITSPVSGRAPPASLLG